ncbi:MAG: molybdopterin molybdenumtransferase MoeA [Microbacteriaceae bacterium]|jgi:molybdopterin molybdotransferase|nr:molybdopterin molybdenumtransferase MoeA [Microbacteriaceae bacterium]
MVSRGLDGRDAPTTHSDPSVEEHAAHIRRLLEPLGSRPTESVPLEAAVGRVTASAVLSPVDLPLFRNSQMDGFAVLASDLTALPATLPVVGEIAAAPGRPARLDPGTVVRIMTGAVVPDGADAIVPVEDTDGGRETVTIRRGRVSGEFVRDRGSDLRAGEQLLAAGVRLASRHLAALAAAGIGRVEVTERVRVAVITAGAELVAPGGPATIGQVYDANSVALVAAVVQAGAVVSVAKRVTDDHEAMRAALDAAVATSDLVITSGGISMGEYEVVREVLEPLGARVGHIAMQPGGPQATATVDGIPVVSFPGNPVSTQVSFEIFVAPILREIAGQASAIRQPRLLAAEVRSAPGKRQFLRGRLLDGARVEVVGGPSSHLVAGLAASDVLIDIPAHTTQLREGDQVETVTL